MLLTVDCGNTNIVIGVFDGDRLAAHWRIATDAKRTGDEYLVIMKELFGSKGLRTADIDQMIVASVVPGVNLSMETLAEEHLHCKPVFVTYATPTGVKIKMDNPAEVGADRLVDALAAHYFHPDTYVIVVDFGTATTFDCISPDGAYSGGVICPGVEITQQALFSHASKLSNVVLRRPPKVIGTNTADSLRSGILWGYAGMVDSMVRRMSDELPDKPFVLATGGLAPLIADYCQVIDEVDVMLTINGLKILADKLQKR